MYFECQGKQNTEETLKIAFAQAEELGIHDIWPLDLPSDIGRFQPVPDNFRRSIGRFPG